MAVRNAFRSADLINEVDELNVVTMERFERRLGENAAGYAWRLSTCVPK